MALLELEDVHTYYGEAHILQGVSLAVGEGEVVSLIGRNGAGKTTTLRSVMGLARPARGRVRLRGEDLTRLPTHEIARRGIAWIPEERRVLPNLTGLEDLRPGVLRASAGEGGARPPGAGFRFFPPPPRGHQRPRPVPSRGGGPNAAPRPPAGGPPSRHAVGGADGGAGPSPVSGPHRVPRRHHPRGPHHPARGAASRSRDAALAPPLRHGSGSDPVRRHSRRASPGPDDQAALPRDLTTWGPVEAPRDRGAHGFPGALRAASGGLGGRQGPPM